MLRTHLSLFSLLCLALSAAASGSDTPAQPQPAAIAHRGHAKPNPFFRRQATRDQIVQRRQAHSQAQVDSGVLPMAEEATLGKQRLSERDSGPSPSPKAGETPCGPQFYLSYAGSGTGADSQFALIKAASDGSDTYLVPVLEKTQASLFALAANGQLVAGASIANLSQDVDILSFDPTSTIQQNGFLIPSFKVEGNKLIAQGSNIAFNVCPPSSYAPGSAIVENNVLHLSSPNSIGKGCFSVTMALVYA